MSVGRVAGTSIEVSASCLLLVGLIAVAFAPRAEALVPGLGAQGWLAGIVVGILVYAAALVHESAHAVLARRHGREVRAIRLTAAGGRTEVAGESAAPREEGLTAAAGPAVSLALGLLALAGRVVVPDGVGALVLEALVLANLLIGCLDLLPAPPLDGGRVVRAIAWQVAGSRARGAIVAGWVGRVVALAVVLVPAIAVPALDRRPSLSLWAICLGVGALVWTASSAEIGFNRHRLAVEGVAALSVARPAPEPRPGEPTYAATVTLDVILADLIRAPEVDHVLVDAEGVRRGVVSLTDVDQVIRAR